MNDPITILFAALVLCAIGCLAAAIMGAIAHVFHGPLERLTERLIRR